MQPNSKEAENTAEFQPYIGRTIGAYSLQSIIGVGGMGAVFVANHTRLDKRVAVKLIRAGLRDQKEAAKRFFSEAKAAAAIGHENIIDVFDVGEDPTLGPYLAMELLDAAESLGSAIYTDGPLTLSRVAKITRQAANALFATHSAGLVHCDLKPSNILLIKALGQKDVVKIIDFGIAREAPSQGQDPLVSSRMVLGTPKFMSPEQAIGRRPDGRSDQYALGILVYAMLSGKPPFDGTPGEVMKRQYHEPPASLCAKRQDITQTLEEVIFRALAKKPEERFSTIQQFGDLLHETIDKILRPRTAPRLPVAQVPRSGPNPKVDLDSFKDMFDEGEGGNTGDHPKLESKKESPPLTNHQEIFDAEGGNTGEAPPTKIPSLADYKAMFETEGDHTGALPVLAPKSTAETTTPLLPNPERPQPPRFEATPPKEEADIFSLVGRSQTNTPIPALPVAYNLTPLPTEEKPAEEEQPSKPQEQAPPPKAKVPTAVLWSSASVALLLLMGSYWSYMTGYIAPGTLPAHERKPREKKVVPSFSTSIPSLDPAHKKDNKHNPKNNKPSVENPTTQEAPAPTPTPELKQPEQIEVPNFETNPSSQKNN